MQSKKGIPVSSGVAIGEAFVLDHEEYRIPKRFIDDTPASIDQEAKRYEEAVAKSTGELRELEKTTQAMKHVSIMFMGHRCILEDPELKKDILDKIRSQLFTAEYAISHVMGKYRTKLDSLKSEYYTRRVGDLHDIENRLLKFLLGSQGERLQSLSRPVILITKTLTPSETAVLPHDKTLAFITDTGGRTSHSAIVARTRGIPAIVGVGDATTDICSGDIVIVDGAKGEIVIDPDEETLQQYVEIQKQQKLRRSKLKKLLNLPVQTLDGYNIHIMANIENPSEVKSAMGNGAMGIGLYRTEFIYINNPSPSEEDHFKAYKEAIKYLGPHKLIIRTLDFGADKSFGIEDFQREENPFLGCRSIRLCFEKIPVFKRQLRAILRASVMGNVDIMFPMISSLEELIKAKRVLEEVKQELSRENIPYQSEIKVGAMIEIPSAAIISDLLAKEVDFFSIGTNDLVQYTLAVDRINEKVAYLYRPAHPAIFRLVKSVIDSAIEHHIKVSICGEMSAEFSYIIPLMGLGLRDFSVSPSLIPECKEFIRSISMRRAMQITNKVLSLRTHQESLEYLSKEIARL